MTNLKGEVTYINAALCIILDEGKPENVLGKDVMAYYSRQEQQKLRDTYHAYSFSTRAMVR